MNEKKNIQHNVIGQQQQKIMMMAIIIWEKKLTTAFI